MPEYTRIDINRFYVDKFLESNYHQENPQISLTQLSNNLIEKFLSGEIVELTPDNFINVKQCSDLLKKHPSFVINTVLEKLDLIAVTQPEKIKMEVTTQKHNVKINKKGAINKISSW